MLFGSICTQECVINIKFCVFSSDTYEKEKYDHLNFSECVDLRRICLPPSLNLLFNNVLDGAGTGTRM